MADFPRLKTGAVIQLPSASITAFKTHVSRFVDGSEQRFREQGTPIMSWRILLDKLTAGEIDSICRFFVAQQGRYGTFSFLDPWTDVEHDNCSFGSDDFEFELTEETRGDTSFVIRRNV